MPSVRIGVLGPLTVTVDGCPVTVPPGRRRSVLACLTVHRGHPVTGDALVEAAWSGDLPQSPHAALHTVISRLRTLLGDDVLVHDGPSGYRLDVPPHAVDATEFVDRLARAETAGTKGARRLLERALALWRGPAYGELGDAPFAAADAMRLTGLRATATERLAALALNDGDPTAALDLTEQLLAQDPFRERAVEVRVTALYRDGRQADALAEYRRYRELLAEELGLDPSPPLQRLEQEVLGHDLSGPAVPPPPTWLDTSTALIGREEDLAALVAAVLANRLTVVTGPGGVGKSRLAAEALPLAHERLGRTASVVELASVTHGGVDLAVAAALGLQADAQTTVADAVVDRLEATGGLLVVDNCEHLLGEVSVLARRLVTRCPQLHVLATSRRRLGIDSEQVFPVEPLAVPAPEGTAPELTASVRLVAQRVRRVTPTFALTPGVADGLGELCRRLDGLPLALELAASRVATRGLAEVLGAVDEARPSPFAGLEDVVDWSYRLLGSEHRELLMLLSVFTGDFTGAQVRGLVAHLPGAGPDVGPGLAELVECSLVEGHPAEGGMRHRVLAVVRDFAGERLRESGRSGDVHRAHAEWVAGVAAGIAADWPHADGAVLDARLRAVSPEVVTAMRWALAGGSLDLAAGIAGAVAACMHWTPGVEMADLFLEVAERGAAAPAAVLSEGVGAGAFVAAERGDLARADRLGRAAVAMADREPVVPVLALAVSAMYRGDREMTETWFARMACSPTHLADAHASRALNACYHRDAAAAEEYVAVALAAGASSSDASRAFAHFAAGEIAMVEDVHRGAELMRRAAAEADRVGAEQVGRVARVALLAATTRDGALAEATELARHLLADLLAKGAWPQLWTTVRLSAELLVARRRAADAAFLLEAGLVAESGPRLVGDDVDRYAALAAQMAGELGPSAVAGIRRLAAATPRARVVHRAEAALAAAAQPSDGSTPTMGP